MDKLLINRSKVLYQKTEFNNHLICQLNTIFKCNKCKKNNNIINNNIIQNCLFCNNPNYTKK